MRTTLGTTSSLPSLPGRESPAYPNTDVPGTGIEPVWPQWPQDFKSCVSTYSTTRAPNTLLPLNVKKHRLATDALERKTRLELATPTLARLCSTN